MAYFKNLHISELAQFKPALFKRQRHNILSSLSTNVGKKKTLKFYFYDFTISMFSQFCQLYTMKVNRYFALCLYNINTSIKCDPRNNKK